MTVEEISLPDLEKVKKLFRRVFCAEPWNDDWSDERQLNLYLQDLMGNPNSLSFGLFEDNCLIGLALGHIRHWYQGTEYCIDELCIDTKMQGKGYGSTFLRLMEERLREKNLKFIFLLTDRDVPAYAFYSKNGYTEMQSSVAFCKEI